MVWSILVAAMHCRGVSLLRLVDLLLFQIDKLGVKDVEVVVALDRGTEIIGDKRNRLVREARGSWISFVDDDDLVSPDYVLRLRQEMRPEVDYVGFNLQLYVGCRSDKPTSHSIRYVRGEDERGYYASISHLNPIRKSIYERVPFQSRVFQEDVNWADAVAASGLVGSEAFVDRVMYYYFFNIDASGQRMSPERKAAGEEVVLPRHANLRSV